MGNNHPQTIQMIPVELKLESSEPCDGGKTAIVYKLTHIGTEALKEPIIAEVRVPPGRSPDVEREVQRAIARDLRDAVDLGLPLLSA
jgi:hypothetical protein